MTPTNEELSDAIHAVVQAGVHDLEYDSNTFPAEWDKLRVIILAIIQEITRRHAH